MLSTLKHVDMIQLDTSFDEIPRTGKIQHKTSHIHWVIHLATAQEIRYQHAAFYTTKKTLSSLCPVLRVTLHVGKVIKIGCQ